MNGYLTQTSGEQSGATFLLNPEAENVIGRGRNCSIVLGDPLCSRIHAVMVRKADAWRIRDGQSRNGTFVNGRPVDEAVLHDRDRVRVGSTEFSFHTSHSPPAPAMPGLAAPRPSVVRQASVDAPVGALGSAAEGEPADDLAVLYQLASSLLGLANRREIVERALACLVEQTGAASASFFQLGPNERLFAEAWLPEGDAPPLPLGDSLVRVVLNERQAVWVAGRRGAEAAAPRLADALCVPVVQEGQATAAIFAARQHGSFQQAQFDFAIAVANLTAKALRGMATQGDESAAPPSSPSIEADPRPAKPRHPSDAEFEPQTLELRFWERRLIELALERCQGHVPEAAKLLGLARATMYRKLAEYGLK